MSWDDDDDEGNEPVSFDNCEVIRETPKALLIKFRGLPGKRAQELWIPKSVIHDDSEIFDFDDNADGTLVLKSWFVRKEGIG